jgi:fumarylacetoacetase
MANLSWIESANRPDSDFPLDNLPWCRFNGGRMGVAIGEYVLEVPDGYHRATITAMLRHDADQRPAEHLLYKQTEVTFQLPFDIGDYTDFYASIHHATNVGKLFRPDNPLLPNYKHVPVAYHGRASSVVVSGTPVKRPQGQLGEGRFGPTEQLDYELELGIFIGRGNALGEPVAATVAADHIAGFCLVNDWSARDIQRWEYQPLGPFLGKSFATTVSPWVVTPEALAPYRVAPPVHDALPYLTPPGDAYDITVEVYLNGELMGRSRTRDLYWTSAQMIAHHTSNGCNLRRGDLLASGTVSGADPEARGCLLERRPAGPFLQDGDEVVMRGYAQSDRLPRIGFGECRGRIIR